MLQLAELLSTPAFSIRTVAAHLDALDPRDRVAQVRSIGKKGQSRLWEAAKGFKPIDLAFLVPEGVDPLVGVVHYGKNSLPLFSHFAKVFCKPDIPGRDGELWGYNASGELVGTWVGPGYFVVRKYDEEGELVIDYTKLPPHRPSDWPPMLRNEERLGRFVYANMQDVLRGISKHVSIGRAIRGGSITNNYFLLCRTAGA
ncbi:MAG: hypothetical protein IT379_08145 [Deltaproteobacteria bacterium]|nr:hypothetical protein [Deltaproteobacteria bacterium]